MPIGTSDGQYFEDEWSYATQAINNFKPSQNVEDYRNSTFGKLGIPRLSDMKEDFTRAIQHPLTPMDQDANPMPTGPGTLPDQAGYNQIGGDYVPGSMTASKIPLGASETVTGESNPQDGIQLSHLAEKLSETWPAKAVKGFIDAVSLPHDAYYGKVDPMSDEGIKRAANFALIFGTGGMESAHKEATVDAIKGASKDLMTSPLDLERAGDIAKSIRSGLSL